MNVSIKTSVLVIALMILNSCATTPREKILQNMFIGATAGLAIGLSKPENKSANALLYSGITASTIGAVSVYLSSIDQTESQLKAENKKLKDDLEAIQSPKTIYQSPAMFNSKIPDKYKKLIQPGEWRISEIDQWFEDSENRIIHQDKIMELIPPSLKTNSN